ncbi:MAG: hypothetical protein WBL25_16665, partial [Anaerolineales bacterium]
LRSFSPNLFRDEFLFVVIEYLQGTKIVFIIRLSRILREKVQRTYYTARPAGNARDKITG